jgi:hypothetical protein
MWLIFLIIVLLVVLQQSQYTEIQSPEGFTQRSANPYFETDFNTSTPDNEYYYDKSGRKPTLYKILKPLTKSLSLKKKPKKIDHTNCVRHKLGIYDISVYDNTCN